MTPWYQLTRLIWYPRSRFVAMAALAGAWGLLVAALTLQNWYLPDQYSDSVSPWAVLLAAVVNAAAVAWVVRRVRRRWSELESLNDAERLTAIHAVYFGEDVGSVRLAEATLEAARWYRRRNEFAVVNRRTPAWEWGLVEFGIVNLLMFSAMGLWFARDWTGFGAMAAITFAAWIVTIRALGERRMERARTNLWYAEWYAAQRLERTDAG